jgi:hypothetical protein
LVTAAFEAVLLIVALGMLAYVARITREVGGKQIADAAMYPQGRRIEEVLREMRESLRR